MSLWKWECWLSWYLWLKILCCFLNVLIFFNYENSDGEKKSWFTWCGWQCHTPVCNSLNSSFRSSVKVANRQAWTRAPMEFLFGTRPLTFSMARSRNFGNPVQHKNYQHFTGEGEALKHCIICMFRNCNYFAILPTTGLIIYSTYIFACSHLAHM